MRRLKKLSAAYVLMGSRANDCGRHLSWSFVGLISFLSFLRHCVMFGVGNTYHNQRKLSKLGLRRAFLRASLQDVVAFGQTTWP